MFEKFLKYSEMTHETIDYDYCFQVSMPQILPQNHNVLTLYLQVNTKLFVIITLQHCVSSCLDC